MSSSKSDLKLHGLKSNDEVQGFSVGEMKSKSNANLFSDSSQNSISSSIMKCRGRLTRMVSVDMDRGESLHQQQLNLQLLCQQKSHQLSHSQSLQSQGTQSQPEQVFRLEKHASKSSSKVDASAQASKSEVTLLAIAAGYGKFHRQLSPSNASDQNPMNYTTISKLGDNASQERAYHCHQRSHSSHHYQSQGGYHGSKRRYSHNRRNLSAEGWLRVQTFQQTHSASSALGVAQRSLRLSADSARRGGSGTRVSAQKHSRSASCLPLSRFRGSSRSREDPNHLSHPSSSEFLSPQRSFDRLSLSPKKSFERNDLCPLEMVPCSRHRTPERRCDKCSVLRSTGSSYESRDQSSVQSPSEGTSGSNTGTSTSPSTCTSDVRSRRSQFRRAISLFSLSCDKETERTKDKSSSSQQKILRPPTRHFYRKGVSGLPVECGVRTMTMAY